MERTILHCDLNNFFASVELVDKPELADKFVAVGGDEQSRHGIILAKNEKAKRCGIKTGETLWTARKKCPELVVLPPNFEKYMYYSKMVRQIYCRYTDLVESFGPDECWCDVSGSRFLFGSGTDIAESIRKTVKKETGLTVSIGVSFNKIMAKLGSDLKKPDAITEIRYEDIENKVWKLDCGMLFGVGEATAVKLKKYGVKTIGDLAHMPCDFMTKIFGKSGISVLNYANGIDESPVMYCDYVPDVKSISRGCTSAFDIKDFRMANLLIISLCDTVAEKLRKYGFSGRVVRLQIRDNELQYSSFSKTVNTPIRTARQLYEMSEQLLFENFTFEHPIRAICVCVASLSTDEIYQTDFYTDYEKLEKVYSAEQSADKIRNRFGRGAIVRGSLMNINFTRNCAIYEFNPFGHNGR